MYRYIILAHPGHNRIYHESAMKISAYELAALSLSENMGIHDIEQSAEGLPAGLSFSTEKALEEEDLRLIGASSICYALFEKVIDGLLNPIPLPDFRYFPESMVQILKYNGKTNEQFTRLMLNLALSICATDADKKTLLDPVAGKGTTLFEGLIRGLDVIGVELHDKWVRETRTFLLRYLKEGMYKHHAEKGARYDEKGRKTAEIFTLVTAANKEDYKIGETQTCNIINADTRYSGRLIKKQSCDIIVADLPYGVQHAGKTDRRSRSPLALLEEALPAWFAVLKNKGSMVLAFNEHTLKHHDLARLLAENELAVLPKPPFAGFRHRVDQSIDRNLIVAVKR